VLVPISAVDSISPAFQHTKRQLLQPFRLGQWARLALVGLLAGEMSSGGGCNFNFQVPHFPRNTGGSQSFLAPALPFGHSNPLLLGLLVGALGLVALILWILFLYVSSVMRFVLFDSILEKECHIGRRWNRRQGVGLRYFVWKILIFLGMIAGIVILVGIPAAFGLAVGWLKNPSQHILPLVLGGIVLFFLFFAFMIALLILEVLSKDFLVPQMALEGISAFEAWRRLWPMLKQEKAGYAGYLGRKVLLALGAAVLVGIVTAILLILVLIPVGGIGVVAILAGKAAGLSWNAYTITVAVVVGSVVLAGILYLFSLISVPAIVFFPAYSIYFFAARYPALAAALYPAPPATAETSPVPPEIPPPPPFLPPTPDAIG
jgi:hypothetical protein